jgi:plastocyanin
MIARWGRLGIAFALAASLVSLATLGHLRTEAAGTVDISMTGFSMVGPNGNGNVTITIGTTVRWTNNESFFVIHNATSNTAAWSPQELSPGQSFSVTFNTPGSFGYTCTHHPGSMFGTITVLAAPTVTGVNPTAGATTGGTTVTITGANFQSGASVSFGGAMATNVAFVDSGTLTAILPAHAAGLVDVTVTNPDTGAGTGSGIFTYVVVNSIPGAKPAGAGAGSNPNPIPGMLPSGASAGGSPGSLPPRRSLNDANGASGAANTGGAPAPAPLPPRR